MTAVPIEERVKKIISEEMGVRLEIIFNYSTFVNDLSADSLDMLNLIIKFEDEFGLKIDDKDAERIQTVNDAIKLIKEKSC